VQGIVEQRQEYFCDGYRVLSIRTPAHCVDDCNDIDGAMTAIVGSMSNVKAF
jgi:hypothetical protein